MESHYKKPAISPNPATDKLLQDWYKDNKPSEIQNAITELCKKVSKNRWELIEKTIASLPTKYASISCGATVNLGGETKTPYFGRKYFANENESEYIFTTVEWYENDFNANVCNSTMHFKIIHEPQ